MGSPSHGRSPTTLINSPSCIRLTNGNHVTLTIRRRPMAAAVAVMLAGVLLGPAAQAAPPGFVAFGEFLSEMKQAGYASMLAAGKAGVVRDAAAFAEMRAHVLGMYDGV